MASSRDIEVEEYEEIVGNPVYSSSSETSKSDPVSFQFKEPRQTECREEDFFARARSRPDPRIISQSINQSINQSKHISIAPYALAGKNSQEPRSCDTFVECGSSRKEFHDNSTILVPTSNTSIRYICDCGARCGAHSWNFRTRQVCDTGAQRGANVKHFHTRQVCDTCSNICHLRSAVGIH